MWMNRSTSRISCNFAALWPLRVPLTEYSKQASLDQLVQSLRKRWDGNETSTINGCRQHWSIAQVQPRACTIDAETSKMASSSRPKVFGVAVVHSAMFLQRCSSSFHTCVGRYQHLESQHSDRFILHFAGQLWEEYCETEANWELWRFLCGKVLTWWKVFTTLTNRDENRQVEFVNNLTLRPQSRGPH